MSVIQPHAIKKVQILSSDLKKSAGINISKPRCLRSLSYTDLLSTVKPFNRNLFKFYEDDSLISTSSYTISYISKRSTMENKIAKVYSKKKIERKKLENMVTREILLHQSDQESRFLAKLENVFQSETELILIFEVGSILVNTVKKQIISSFDQWKNLMVFKIQSLCFINNFGVTLCGEFSHSNFLYDENSGDFKLFNIGKNWNHGDIHKQKDVGEPLNSKVDVFQLGKLVYESLGPFMRLPQFDEDDDPEELLDKLKEYQLDPILIDWFSCLLQNLQRHRIPVEKLNFHEFLVEYYQENPKKLINLDEIYQRGEVYNTNRLLFKPQMEPEPAKTGQSERQRRFSIQKTIDLERRGSHFNGNSIAERANFFLHNRPQTVDTANMKPRKSILHLLEKNKKSGFGGHQFKTKELDNIKRSETDEKSNSRFYSSDSNRKTITEDNSSSSTMKKYNGTVKNNNHSPLLKDNSKKKINESQFKKEKQNRNPTVKSVAQYLNPRTNSMPRNTSNKLQFSAQRKDRLIQNYKNKKKRRNSPDNKQNTGGFFGSLMGLLGCNNAYT